VRVGKGTGVLAEASVREKKKKARDDPIVQSNHVSTPPRHHQPGTHHSCVVSTAIIKCKPLQRGVNMATYTVHAFGKESLFFLNGDCETPISFANKKKQSRTPPNIRHRTSNNRIPRPWEICSKELRGGPFQHQYQRLTLVATCTSQSHQTTMFYPHCEKMIFGWKPGKGCFSSHTLLLAAHELPPPIFHVKNSNNESYDDAQCTNTLFLVSFSSCLRMYNRTTEQQNSSQQ